MIFNNNKPESLRFVAAILLLMELEEENILTIVLII
jgi:hypothetical protein